MRGLVAVVMTLALLMLGCSPGTQDPTQAPRDLPDAEAAVKTVADALNAKDLSKAPLAGDSKAAQRELKLIYAGMDGVYPKVEAGRITYSATEDTATATMKLSYGLGVDGWGYESEARLRHTNGQWRLEWAPSLMHPELTEQTRLRLTQREATRGTISDLSGNALVEQRTQYEVGLDKSAIPQQQWAAAAAQLAGLVKTDTTAFQAKVAKAGEKAFVVAAKLPQAQIPAAVSKVPGGHVREVASLEGPTPTFARSLLGTVGQPTAAMITKSGGKLNANDKVGLTGLQQRYDTQLRGVPFIKIDLVARKDATDVTPKTLFQQDESVSKGIQVSLDRELQTKAEQVLSTQSSVAALVVIDIKTGALRVAAQSPAAGTYPHATFGSYAPGSTFKTVSALAMLRKGMTPASTVQCPAKLNVGGYTFGNYPGYPAGALGPVSLTTGFKESCNTVFTGASRNISASELQAAAGSLGVGTDYDAGFSSNFGSVKPGGAVDKAASMIGQGSVTMSPLAMTSVAASVASGKTVVPWLVKGKQAAPKAQALSPAEAQQLRSMMKATVDSGTGKPLQGVMTGAKTGTAQWGKAGELKTSAWMIAYNQNYAVTSFVQVGDSGGSTAAPLIRQLFQ